LTASHLTDTEKLNSAGKKHKLNTYVAQNANNAKCSKTTTVVQLPVTTLGQEARWATTLQLW